MKVITRLVTLTKDNKLDLVDVDFDNFNLSVPAVMAIDGSTTCTGVSFVDRHSGNLLGTMAIIREDESKVRYKVKYKEIVYKLLKKLDINNIFYEEPYIGYTESTKALFLIRSSIEELIIEHEPELDHIKYIEVNNKKWKKLLLGDGNCPTGTELEKAAIKKYVTDALPFMTNVTQDEMDATGLGFIAVTQLQSGHEETLKSRKKPKEFKYNIKFIGADDDDDFIEQLNDELPTYKIPQVVLDNGMEVYKIGGRGIFENYIFEKMGDKDKLLVLYFSSKTHGNVVLENRISNLTTRDFIYAVIWRKSRKKV